jgi:vacuolar-type H+-ATPase subunit I/STV1
MIYRKITEYSDTWLSYQSTYEEKPISIRLREGLIPAQGHFDYPFQIGIATPLLDPITEGLTTSKEAEVLYLIEDALQSTLEQNEECVFALVITTSGMREFVFYASKWKPEFFERKVQEINSLYNDHKLQFMMQEDKEWNTFKNFLPADTDLRNENLELKQQLIEQIDDLTKQLNLIKSDDDVDTSGIQKIEEKLSELLQQLQSVNPDGR